MRRTLLLVCAVVALAGCRGPAYDEAAHRAEVEAVRGPVEDWPKLRDNMRALCQVPADQFATVVRLNAGAGIDLGAHVKHLCPDRLDEAQAAKEDR